MGPLASPVTDRSVHDVVYVDHATTEDLRSKYAGDEAVGEIADVDVVWGDRRLATALSDHLEHGGFHFAIASHVIEHVPDLIGWLQQVAEVLEPGGTLRLAVPDKRFCFDVRRAPSDVAEMIEAHLAGRTRPPVSAVFDFWTRFDDVDVVALWAGATTPTEAMRDELALSKARESIDSDGYTDVHCWVFTPATFLESLRRLAQLDFLPFEVASFAPTVPPDIEFFVFLQRPPEGVAPAELRRRQLESIAAAERTLEMAPSPEVPVTLSPRERRLIEAKRRVMGMLRSIGRG